MNILPFNFKNKDVRVIQDENNEPWFVLADICKVLDLSNPTMVADRLDDDEKCNPKSGLGLRKDQILINESGFYSVILRSNKPEAKSFKKWVTSDVLPSIRKTGFYSTSQPLTALELAREQVILLEKLEATTLKLENAITTKAEIGSKREATAMNTASIATKKVNELEIELDQSKEYCTIKRMEMLKHGQKFKWQLLKNTAIEMGMATTDVFDANYGTVKAYHSDVWLEAYAINVREVA